MYSTLNPVKDNDEVERRRETGYWSKAVLGLKIIKVSVSGFIAKTFQDSLLEWTSEELEHLPHFFRRVHNIFYQVKTKKWKIDTSCPSCPYLFEKVLQMHQNPKSSKIVWKPDNSKQKYSGSQLIKQKYMDDRCNICNEKNCIFHAEREGIDLQDIDLTSDLAEFHTDEALDSVSEYYWRIGNMFMFHGKEKNSMKNTSPADTDPSLVFKMMKSCNLFKKDDELYDEVLEVRNYLMHSPNQRIPKDDFDNCIEVFTEFLTKFEIEWSACSDGKREIEKLITSLSIDKISLSKLYEDASKIQKEAITFDIHVSGRFGLSVLQGILNFTGSRTGNNENRSNDKSDDLRSENDRLKRQIDELKKEIEENRGNTSTDEREKFETEKANLRAENNRLEQQILELERKIAELEDSQIVKPSATWGAADGAAAGAMYGAVGGAPGMFIGGVIGGVLGGIIGSKN